MIEETLLQAFGPDAPPATSDDPNAPVIMQDLDAVRVTAVMAWRATRKIYAIAEMRRRDIAIQQSDDVFCVECPRDATPISHYLDEGFNLLPRPVIAGPEVVTVTAGQSFTLQDLPQPCTLRLDGVEHVIDDGHLEMPTAMRGEFKIELAAWPYHDKQIAITVE